MEAIESTTRKRLFTNAEIQKRIVAVAEKLPNEELNKFLDRDHSNEIFGVRLPLFIRIKVTATTEDKNTIKKDQKGYNRYTWKYEFSRAGYNYAIVNDWYPRHDKNVKKWLDENE
ncbi:hypothetical protein [Marinifilum flexuosum]|uniref:Uncharacterized protein n=1 Tax=Marinifilum flexuosum TaxID=1117708 RepID=A0A419X8U3_9BACT|nr:hypothetical protein [Marinifilum flexuosum]RKE04168.1 hypothetical protein BXY64_1184 [Marinifilum flexuosum]